jgi:hypothetical protein
MLCENILTLWPKKTDFSLFDRFSLLFDDGCKGPKKKKKK